MIEWYFLAFISAFFSASSALVEKKILFKEKALSFSFILALFNIILAIPFFFFVNLSNLTFSGLIVLFFKSFLGALSFLCVMLGIKNLELSEALPLLVLTPGFVAFFAFLFLGESLLPTEIIGMALLLSGTYILQLKTKQKMFDPLKKFLKSKGRMYIVYALILFTTTSVLDKAILSKFKVPINAFMGFQHLFLALIFFSFILFSSRITESSKTLKRSWTWIFILSVFTILYRYTYIWAVKLTSVALALSIKRVSVFFAVVIGGKIFKEKDLLRKSIATAIMIGGALLIIRYS